MSAHRRTLVDLIRKHLGTGPLLGAEIGVQSGKTSAEILRYCRNVTLLMVDPWKTWDESEAYWADPTARGSAAEWDLTYQRALAETDFAKDRRVVMRMTSAAAAQFGVDDGSLDLCFVDANHSKEAVAQDFRLWYPKVRAGGLLMGHDYGNECDWTKGVKPAIDEFAAEYGLTVNVGAGYVAWMVK